MTVLTLAAASYAWVDRPLTRSVASIDTRVVAFFKYITEFGESQWYLLPSGAIVLVVVLLRSLKDEKRAAWCAASLALLSSVAAIAFPMIGLRRGEYAWTIAAVLVGVAMWWRGRRYAGWAALMFLSVAVSGIAANIFKIIFGRNRPSMLFESGAFGFEFFRSGYDFSSFPSGHATSAAAACVVLCYRWPAASIVWVPAALLMCASRLFTESHYLSDVMAGALLGSMTALLCRDFMLRIDRLR